ncbi:MAG TPA: FAD-dependent thymidylate synthase, partial [Candidatus Goldiibacteriota bacterium]|nr:FAD-dependent thymidylate synthase [Candidatus Goldiibacteriota bacterium]
YTEKSQRYITLEGDYVRPAEFKGRELRVFDETVKIQVETYKKMLPVLFEYQKKKNPGMLASKSGLNTVEGWAKEDARYVLPIATECQLGFSANARNLEHIIRKLKYCGLNEARQLGTMLYEKAKHVVPSLIILSDPDAFKRQFGREVSDGLLKSGSGSVIKAMSKIRFGKAKPSVKPALLLEHTADPDTKIIAALLHSYSGRNYGACLAASVKMGKNAKKVFMKAILRDATEHDPLYREFEAAVFKMELVLSSSAFAQLKRHRMMSLFKQSYDIKLGVTVPPAVKETKQEALFMKVIEATDKAYSRLACASPEAAQYILTNSHRRRVIISANLREIYHIARLRMDR